MFSVKADPDVSCGASDGDPGGLQLLGVATDGGGYLAGVPHGIKRGLLAYNRPAEMIKHVRDGRWGRDTCDGPAAEHLFDGIEKSVVHAIGESEMDQPAVGRSISGNGTSGFQKRNRKKVTPREVRGMKVEGENRTSPLLAERVDQLFFSDHV